LAFILLAALGYLALGLAPDPLATGGSWDWSVRVTDRRGETLREFISPSLSRRDLLKLSEFSPLLVSAIVSAEDKRFWSHPGVDPLAIARAAFQDVRARSIKSGGSTITMQLARLTLGLSPGPRTFRRKLKETFVALLIERLHSKEEILEAYLNLAPTGSLAVGFEAASRQYFGKKAAVLSPAEAALLAALPASPSAFNPLRRPARALSRRAWILQRMASLGYLDEGQAERAAAEPLRLNHNPPPYLAPHYVAYLRQFFPEKPPETIRGALDLEIQREIEIMAQDVVNRYRPFGMEQVSVVVFSLPEREILAWVGSGDFYNPKDGQVDGVLAPRQPGSALKPFIYAMALEKGLITPASLLSDEPADFVGSDAVFSPRNYSGNFLGPVPARQALASSLNVPAVNLSQELGLENVLARFQELGLNSLDRDYDYYGLALSLGGGEVSLLELTRAYAALADGGLLKDPVLFRVSPFAEPLSPPRAKRVFAPGVAWLVSDILADDFARAEGFGTYGILRTPYPSSVKTGTSTNFKDNWCLGFTDRFVVGVWAGNFQAQPMSHISGVMGAGQLWRSVSDLLAAKFTVSRAPRPKEVLSGRFCPISGLPAGPDCPNAVSEYYLADKPLPAPCDHSQMEAQGGLRALGREEGFRLLAPRGGEIYAFDPGLPPDQHQLKAYSQSVPAVDELVWLLNGEEISRARVEGHARSSILLPLQRGEWLLELVGLRENMPPLRAQARYLVK
jgi:penicillin-binding protein 1C